MVMRRPGQRSRWTVLILAVAMLFGLLGQSGGSAQTPDASATIELVHAAPALGTVDLYLDGSLALIGLRYGDTADALTREPGEHAIAVVPSGGGVDNAVLTGTVDVAAGASEIAILGGADVLSLDVFPLDLSPLPPAQARLRFINGATVFGPADLALTGGDLFFPSADEGAATEAADIAAGGYDLELRYSGSDVVALALPGFTVDPGVVYSLYLVGDGNAGNLQTLVSARPASVPVETGAAASIRRGSCAGAATAEVVADLLPAGVSPFGDAIGYLNAVPTAGSFTTIGVSFAELAATTHSFVISEDGEDAASVALCGEIGGRLTLDGALAVGLRPGDQPGGADFGIAILTPNLLDPNLTDVSLFVALPGMPLPAASDVAPVPAATPVS